MSRRIITEDRIHPAIQSKIAENHRDIVEEVQQAIDDDDVVVVGMAVNFVVKQARKLLTQRGVPFRYLEYGGYLGQWRRRNALKMWTGWPTFPMIFVKGTLIGGGHELKKLAESGELDRMLKAPRGD